MIQLCTVCLVIQKKRQVIQLGVGSIGGGECGSDRESFLKGMVLTPNFKGYVGVKKRKGFAGRGVNLEYREITTPLCLILHSPCSFLDNFPQSFYVSQRKVYSSF